MAVACSPPGPGRSLLTSSTRRRRDGLPPDVRPDAQRGGRGPLQPVQVPGEAAKLQAGLRFPVRDPQGRGEEGVRLQGPPGVEEVHQPRECLKEYETWAASVNKER